MSDTKNFEVIIKVMLPGNTRATTHKFIVNAASRGEALDKSEGEWMKYVMKYDASVKEVQ
jgi:hypothetical protein